MNAWTAREVPGFLVLERQVLPNMNIGLSQPFDGSNQSRTTHGTGNMQRGPTDHPRAVTAPAAGAAGVAGA